MQRTDIEKHFMRAISQILEVAEACYGAEDSNKNKWEFYRTSLLKRLNELKRDVLNKEIKREPYGTNN